MRRTEPSVGHDGLPVERAQAVLRSLRAVRFELLQRRERRSVHHLNRVIRPDHGIAEEPLADKRVAHHLLGAAFGKPEGTRAPCPRQIMLQKVVPLNSAARQLCNLCPIQ
jgi:hypothetical protein